MRAPMRLILVWGAIIVEFVAQTKPKIQIGVSAYRTGKSLLFAYLRVSPNHP